MSITTDNHPSSDRDDEDAAGDSYTAGRAAMERGDMETAVEHLKRSLAAVPHFKTLELLGTACKTLQRADEALLYLAAAAGLGNRQFRPRYLLAKILLERGLAQSSVSSRP